MNNLKIDLHTHSTASPDGSLSLNDYDFMLNNNLLNYIAVTDHNTIEQAQIIQNKLGQQIIVGEEILTQEGEIIGLFLTKIIPANLSLQETIFLIKKQSGLVYLPHPLESQRHGLNFQTVQKFISSIDIIECYNGRSLLNNHHRKIIDMIEEFGLVGAASSDSHGRIGFGRTYSIIEDRVIDQNNLITALETANYHYRSAGLIARLYPTINRLRK